MLCCECSEMLWNIVECFRTLRDVAVLWNVIGWIRMRRMLYSSRSTNCSSLCPRGQWEMHGRKLIICISFLFSWNQFIYLFFFCSFILSSSLSIFAFLFFLFLFSFPVSLSLYLLFLSLLYSPLNIFSVSCSFFFFLSY